MLKPPGFQSFIISKSKFDQILSLHIHSSFLVSNIFYKIKGGEFERKLWHLFHHRSKLNLPPLNC